MSPSPNVFAVLMAAGVAIGAVGEHVRNAVAFGAGAVTHAWDVRLHTKPDHTVEYRVQAWFSEGLADGGLSDLGPGKDCRLDQAVLAQQAEALKACAPQ